MCLMCFSTYFFEFRQTDHVTDMQEDSLTMMPPDAIGRSTSRPNRTRSWHEDHCRTDTSTANDLDPELRLTDSLDEHIGQVLRLTRQLTSVAYGKVKRDEHEQPSKCSTGRMEKSSLICHENDLDLDPAVPGQGFPFDGDSSDQNDPDSWDVDQPDCCSASLSDLLDDEDNGRDDGSEAENEEETVETVQTTAKQQRRLEMKNRENPPTGGLADDSYTQETRSTVLNSKQNPPLINGTVVSCNAPTFMTLSESNQTEAKTRNYFFTFEKEALSGQKFENLTAEQISDKLFHTFPSARQKAAHKWNCFDRTPDDSAAEIKEEVRTEMSLSLPSDFVIDGPFTSFSLHQNSNKNTHNFLAQAPRYRYTCDGMQRFLPQLQPSDPRKDEIMRASWPPGSAKQVSRGSRMSSINLSEDLQKQNENWRQRSQSGHTGLPYFRRESKSATVTPSGILRSQQTKRRPHSDSCLEHSKGCRRHLVQGERSPFCLNCQLNRAIQMNVPVLSVGDQSAHKEKQPHPGNSSITRVCCKERHSFADQRQPTIGCIRCHVCIEIYY